MVASRVWRYYVYYVYYVDYAAMKVSYVLPAANYVPLTVLTAHLPRGVAA